MIRVTQDNVLLRQAEIEAEAVVSLLRICVALGLLIMFFLAVGGAAEVRGQPQEYLHRQWVFAVTTMVSYLLMGCVTFWMARRGRIRSWMVWPIVTIDCLFMLANTWVGLENTALPGDLTFIFPPTWLVPVVLAFAVLRFNPYLQAYCAGLSALGLAWLILWQPEEISPDALERAQTLLSGPPNIIRLTMIVLAGLVLVVAAYRMRVVLHRSIHEAESKANLTRYLPGQLTRRLEREGLDELREGRQQQMAVLFVDIRGFTQWSQGREPVEVGEFITAFRRRVQTAADTSGGMIDKFIGDAAMLLFEGDTAAADGLRCAEDLAGRISDWSQARVTTGETPVAVGIGLHWGPVFAGVVGDVERLEYSVFGDTVNIAARLEQLTKIEDCTIILSRDTLDAAGLDTEASGWSQLPSAELRGREGWIAIFGK